MEELKKGELFDEFGNIKITTNENNKKKEEKSEKLGKALGSIEIFSSLSLIWVFGCFYSFIIENNNNVGYLFLGLITLSLLYFLIIIWKARK